MLTTVLYQLAVLTDNSIDTIVQKVGTAGIEEMDFLRKQHAYWSTNNYVSYYVNKYGIVRGNVIHHTKVLTAAHVLDHMIGILVSKGYSYADAVMTVSKTKCTKQLEMGDPLYFPMFYDAFEEEVGLVASV